MKNKKLTDTQQKKLFELLQNRFNNNMHRHKNIEWNTVEKKLLNAKDKIVSLNKMELTEGEPDVIGYDAKTKEFLFCDCSAESPKGRRSLCYDGQALESRKENKPKNSAIALAEEMGVEIVTEQEYRDLQKIEHFDAKTSSWVKTPPEIRKLGGALFCDYRYGTVFVYHNGAESYYAARGFRVILRV